MICPALQDDRFLADVEDACLADQRLHLWWLGQSGYLLAWGGKRVLLDPYLSDSLTSKYAETDKPHVRMTERVIDPARLIGINLVTSSHGHTDHLDPETLKPLARANPRMKLVFPEAIRGVIRQRSGLPESQLLGLESAVPGFGPCGGVEEVQVEGLQIRAVPAAHETLETDAAGRLTCLGYVVSMGPWRIYHSGDTVMYEGQAELLRSLRVDLALLPVNGRASERRVAGNLWGQEAAGLAWQIGAKIAIPCHYDLFKFNTAPPDDFVMACQQSGQGYAVLRSGERWTFPEC
ncbi:MAG: MBL fold metallo-hydrolase [Pedosphaera sp.]|nr:MBL fold metallo-hydrolase [Pedosphaera sp.]